MIYPASRKYLIVHISGVMFSFFAFVPMSITIRRYDGKCILFSTGNTTNDVVPLEAISWSSSANCNYIVFLGITTLFLSLIFLSRCVWFLYKEFDGSPFYYFTSMMGSAVMVLCTMIAAMIIAAGYSQWCHSITSNSDVKCSEVLVKKSGDEKMLTFNGAMVISQVGTWFLVFMWIAAFLLYFFKVRFYHKNHHLLEAFAKEKNTLIPHRERYERIGTEEPTT